MLGLFVATAGIALGSGRALGFHAASHAALPGVGLTPVTMLARSSWEALDDPTIPLGVLEQDALVVFNMLDENGDGSITQTEMSARLSACNYGADRIELVFGKIDTNNDGKITQDEWQAAYLKHPTLRTAPGLGGSLEEKLHADADAIFASLDADGDGTITEAELREHLCEGCNYDASLATSMLKALDFDASGEIDRDEFRKGFIKHPAMRTAPGLGGGPCSAV